jgi:hypothetical protein
MAPLSEKLTRKQEQAVLSLLANRSVEDAARACNTPVRTMFRWLKEPNFNAAYRDAKRVAFGQGIARLHHLTSAAVSTLGKVMADSGTPRDQGSSRRQHPQPHDQGARNGGD